MSNEHEHYAIMRDLESFGTPGRLAKLIRFSMNRIGWIILPLILLIYSLSPELEAKGIGVFVLLFVYLAYQLVIEHLQWRQREFYETKRARFVRIQIRLIMASVLIYLTGGAQSYFWFFYLWSLGSAALISYYI